MRGHLIGASVLLGLATAAVGAPSALAQDTEAPFLAAPGNPLEPGTELHIQGYCPDPDAGPLTAPALTDIQLLHDPSSGPPNLNASGVVAEGTEPGVYPVTMDCAGETLRVVFTVVGHEQSAPGSLAIAGDGRPQPGDAIGVVVRCAGEVGQPSSPVLDIGELHPVESPDDVPVYVADATIDADTAPGDYPLTAPCFAEVLSTTFTVYPSDDEGTDDDGTQVTRTPRGAPETGGGESTTHPLAGLLAVGAAATVVASAWVRRVVRRS